MAALLATGLKALFFAIACVFGASLIWGLYAAGNPLRKELFTPWMPAFLAEYHILFFTFALWIVYKEYSNFVYAAILVVLLWWAGSLVFGTYIFVQLLKLSPEESAQDPIYHVLLRHEHKSYEEQKVRNSPVIAARITFTTLGCLMIAALICSVMTDGSPFRKEVFLTPWLVVTLVDLCNHIVALSVWVVYKETSWLNAFAWIVVFICFGSIGTCGYITWQLFQLSSQDPLYLILLKNNSRAARVPLLSSV